MSKDKTAAERNRRLREKQAREGLVLVQVKVPAQCRDAILEIALKMRNTQTQIGLKPKCLLTNNNRDLS